MLGFAGAAHSEHIRWGVSSQSIQGWNPRGEEVRHFSVVLSVHLGPVPGHAVRST